MSDRCPHCGKQLYRPYRVNVTEEITTEYAVLASTLAEAQKLAEQTFNPSDDRWRGVEELPEDAPEALDEPKIIRRRVRARVPTHFESHEMNQGRSA